MVLEPGTWLWVGRKNTTLPSFQKKLAQSFHLVCPAIACFGKYLKAAIWQQFPITFCSKKNNVVVEWRVDGTFTMWLKGF